MKDEKIRIMAIGTHFTKQLRNILMGHYKLIFILYWKAEYFIFAIFVCMYFYCYDNRNYLSHLNIVLVVPEITHCMITLC